MNSATAPATDALEEATSVFVALRPRLMSIAHRILGNAAEAEDVVQEAWVRWQNTDRTRVFNPPAFLARTTARLAFNILQSARSRHETGFGPEYAEVADAGPGPAAGVERTESLEAALRLLLENLDPPERAAYVLRVAFDYPHSQIADNLRLSRDHSRQLVSRAGKRLLTGPRRSVSAVEHQRFLEAFVAAARAGDLTGLENALAVTPDRERTGDAERSLASRVVDIRV